ncbi:MAG: glycosyltransferase family 9 protein [Gammaproteobacteria bacterium]|nr:glycosyltransferase family 9 protein [Gammaproteobacteria bacterium]
MTTSTHSILVIAVPNIGDVLVATPLLAALRSAFPDARIDLLLHSGTAGIVAGNRDITEVIEIPPSARPRAALRMLRSRFRAYDTVLCNSASDRMALYSLLLGRRRIGRLARRTSLFSLKHLIYTDHTDIDAERHALTETSELGRLIRVDVEAHVVPPSSPHASAALDAQLGDTWRREPFAVIHPGPSLPRKRWQAKSWRDVTEHLRRQGLHVYISGGPDTAEREYIEKELRLEGDGVTNIAGKLSLAEMAELLSRARLCVCVDTLIGHLAAAVGIPTIVLFGSINLRQWAPWPAGTAPVKSPYEASGTQFVSNIAVIHSPPDPEAVARTRTPRTPHGKVTGLARLGTEPVIAAIERML